MPFIIGTAGHIDHGKTSLVKALTGEDTDRLKEEKERGISIELGFAHLDLPDGTRAGVIDVPGHERFIRTMVAGSHGVDLVLVTVAADDGVMPQTVEHLDILHLLGVRRGIFVLTKIDLATAARAADVTRDIERLASGTSLEGSPIVPFSSVTNEGLDALVAAIGDQLQRLARTPPNGYFRLPVDRVFALHGHGLVVTGTALQGDVRTGDRLRSLPGGQVFRVRSVQVHGEGVEHATWGRRVALNLAGQERPAIVRGDVLCDERLTMTSDRFDAVVEVRPTAAATIKSHQRVRVHIGTAERLGKIVILTTGHRDTETQRPREYAIEPGQTAFCQLVVPEPLVALRGDRFIVRDETAQRTLGGGIVLHPWPAAHRRGDPGLEARLQALRTGDAGLLAGAFVDEQPGFACGLEPLHHFLNLRAEEAIRHAAGNPEVRLLPVDGEQVFTTRRKWAAAQEALLDMLREFHATHPLEAGRDVEALRERLPLPASPKVFRAFLVQLESDGAIAREGSLVRLPGHRVVLRSKEQEDADRIRELLGRTPLAPPDPKQMAADLGPDGPRLLQVLRVLERERVVVRVGGDLYFLRQAVEDAARTLRDELPESAEITPRAFCDRFQTTRKYAIPLLEHLDREGVTIRTGDTRRLRQWRKSPAASGQSSSG